MLDIRKGKNNIAKRAIVQLNEERSKREEIKKFKDELNTLASSLLFLAIISKRTKEESRKIDSKQVLDLEKASAFNVTLEDCIDIIIGSFEELVDLELIKRTTNDSFKTYEEMGVDFFNAFIKQQIIILGTLKSIIDDDVKMIIFMKNCHCIFKSSTTSGINDDFGNWVQDILKIVAKIDTYSVMAELF